jgi:hypothetical protein
VKVIRIDDKNGKWIGEPEIVAPHTTKDFYVWDGQDLLIAEETEAGQVAWFPVDSLTKAE